MLPKNLMVVLSNAMPDTEDEFNDWYSNVHVVEVTEKLVGFEAARRYRLDADQVETGAPYRYLAIYELADDGMAAAKASILHQREERAAAEAAGRRPMISNRKELFDGPHLTMFFEAVDG